MIRTLMCGTEVISDMYVADTYIKRFLGYMFRRKPHHEAILIKPCNSIHTFFMKFKIDVLFINERMEIISRIDALQPGRVIMPIREAAMVIEAREGALKNFKPGDKISVFYGDNIYKFSSNRSRLTTFLW